MFQLLYTPKISSCPPDSRIELFETETAEKLAAKLAALSPEGFNRSFFVSGGSEAVESAIKLARQYKLAVGEAQRWKAISRFPSYHGSTLGALALTGYAPLTAPFDVMMRPMPKVPAPRAYLDGLDPTDPQTGRHYADMLEAQILAKGPETVLAFIVEPIGGASTGCLMPPAGYMQQIREICDAHDVVLIHDEVISGGGRSGTFFGNYMRKCASGGQSLANAERGVGMSGYKWICWQDRGLTRLRPHWDQGRVLHFGLETGCDYTTIVRW